MIKPELVLSEADVRALDQGLRALGAYSKDGMVKLQDAGGLAEVDDIRSHVNEMDHEMRTRRVNKAIANG